ncbi:ribonuclease H-like domain-containing protein [Tanacetum coccineum]
MELESTNSGPTAKLPILKLGEYEMWFIKIKQYFQIQDYTLCEVIENGDSWVSVPQTTQDNGTSVTKMFIHVTAEEKINKKNDKIVSRLAILGIVISQEDLNLKFFSSLPPEWNTHVVVRMNKPEVETISIDDLYNNFKIVEQKVKKSVGGSSGAQNLAFMTAPSTNSTNDTNTASPQVSTAIPNVNAASPQVSTACINDNTVYAFMVENLNGSNVQHQDLEQIHEDDLEAMDLKAPRSKESQFRNHDNTRKQGNNEDKSSKAMLAIDGVGFDWSDMAEEQVQTNMALMAFSDSKVYTDKTCSKTCMKNYETLKKQCDDLLVKLNESELKETTYKRGCKDYEINVLKSEFEKVKQEKDGINFKIEKFDKASKDLDQLLGSQITDKCKKGLGYSAVPPPHPLIYNRPNKLDPSYFGLDEFKEPKFKGYGPKDSKQESNVVCDKKSDNSKENYVESLVEEQVSQDTSSFVESSPNVDKETVFPVNKKVEFTKPKNHEKPVKKSVRYAEMYRSQSPRGNQRNWNGQKSNQLGKDFVMYNKACFICGSFNHLQINCDNHQRRGIVSRNNYNRVDAKTTHPSVHRNMSPKAVLLKTGLTPLNTVRPVNTVRPRVVNTARPYTTPVSAVRVKGVNAVKSSAYWVWRPTKPNGSSLAFKRHNYIDARGRSKSVIAWISRNLMEVMLHLEDEHMVVELLILLKIPKKDNMYCFDMKNIVPKESLTCLVAKATLDESMLWHRILGHINFKNINKLVKHNLVRGLPTKHFENDQTCVSCLKGKQHRASSERRNRTLIEAARTTLADSKLSTTFCAEAVSTACYVQNRVLVVKPHNKTPYELFRGFKPALSFMRPFGCHVTILNTLDSLGKFYGKSDEGFFVGYSLSSKAFRVYNTRTRRVEENLHIGFLENKPMIEGNGTSEENSQDCIVMPIWKDTSYFDSPSKDVDNGEPKTANNAQKQVEDGPNNDNI